MASHGTILSTTRKYDRSFLLDGVDGLGYCANYRRTDTGKDAVDRSTRPPRGQPVNEPAFTTESTVSNEFGHHTLRWSDIEGVVHALLKSSPASPKTPEATDLILVRLRISSLRLERDCVRTGPRRLEIRRLRWRRTDRACRRY